MVDIKEKLIDLIEYVDKLIKIGEKPVFSLKKYRQLLYHEANLKNRIGITHNILTDEEQVWLKIERLQRIDPPAVPLELKSWLLVSRDPFSEPKVKDVVTATILKEDAESYLNNGTLLREDILESMKQPDDDTWCDVIFRLDRQTEIRAGIEKYIRDQWAEWSETEKPRRETIRIYESFFSVQQLIQTGSAEGALEIVWGIGVSLWNKDGHTIDRPIIEQLVEIEINAKDGTIRIRPRSTNPVIALEPYFALEVPGAQTLFDAARQFFDDFPDDKDPSPFLPETFEPVLRQAATHLDKNGQYYPDNRQDAMNRTIPDIAEYLTVTDTWTIFARRRSDNFYKIDLEKLKKAIHEAKDLPGPSKRLVSEPGDRSNHDGGDRLNIVGVPGGAKNGRSHIAIKDQMVATQPDDFFFPKPYNEEQISIIQQIEKSDGVVVQGPPGTGKTHTIANIICHYLATGRRVLVTSKGEAALTVLQEHIPEDIRDLTISLLTNEKQGLKQLEKAIGILSNTASQKREAVLKQEIVDLQQRILNIRTKMAAIDSELLQWAEKHLRKIKSSGQGETLIPMDIARLVCQNREKHEWLPDRPKSKPTFSDDDIAKIRAARKKLEADLIYVNKTLPSINDLPNSDEIAAIHQDLSNAASLERKANDEEIPLLSVSKPNALERANNLLDAVEGIIQFYHMAKDKPWIGRLYDTWRKKGHDAPESKLFNDLILTMASLTQRRLEILKLAVEAPQEAHQSQYVCKAVENAATGKRAFGLVSFGKSTEKELFRQIKVEGRLPDSVEGWLKAKELLDYQKELVSFASRWNAIAPEFDLPQADPQKDIMGGWITGALTAAELTKRTFQHHVKTVEKELPVLFPHGIEASEVIESERGAAKAKDILKLNLSKNRLLRSRNSIDVILRRLVTCSGSITDDIKLFLRKKVGVPTVSTNEIAERWQHLVAELRRLNDLLPAIKLVKAVAASVESGGAPKWSRALLSEPVRSSEDPWTPGYWRESWMWALQDQYLRQIDGRERIQSLSKQRQQCEKDLSKTYDKLIQHKTYLGLKKNITPKVETALVMFSAAIRKIGKGTGVRAHRYRRDAQDAMEKSYSAVPCWIMPSWRVSESLPAIVGSFDLVIIDEASQSDITALPAMLRGKKVLIVGDDRQVSPTGAFIEERKLLQLRHNYLQNQPFGPLLLPGGSLYEVANAIFPGQRIMLKEHFRCVEPIIRFSMQFYPEPIIPLRIPKASERLDPPLIDVHVTYGRKDRRQINQAEAEAIVDEIVKLTEDPEFATRTIGVVSLIGAKQAQHIQALLLGRIGEEKFLKNQIVCGDSAAFQGKERHIMFVSMVECPETKSAKTALMYEQRFNVALSRARDRMYLYRSVTEEMLKPNDLKAKVIQHFNNPMESSLKACDDLIDLCESDFEREVFKRLVEMGYRVKPQVKVGPYSIDLVVEGVEDRRLAIELDGDQYHTPDRWADDFSRQRILERVGWRFWRCWGSSFVLAPEECMQDLKETLKSLGIDPIGYAPTASAIYTEHRVIEPTVQPDEEETVEEVPPEVAEFVGEEIREQIPIKFLEDSEIKQEEESLIVEAGDRVLIVYNDEPSLRHTIKISTSKHDPDMKIIHRSKPLAMALMDAELHEEVEIPAGSGTRIVTILGIEKGEIDDRTDRLSDVPDENEGNSIKDKNDLYIQVDPEDFLELKHTKVLNGLVGRERVKNWNHLSQIIHSIAYEKLGSFEKVAEITNAKIVKGERADKGFRFLSKVNLSIQGESASKVWNNTLSLAKKIKVPIELEIEWRNKRKAANPGKRAVIRWDP